MKNILFVFVALIVAVANMWGQAQTSFVKTVTLENSNTPLFALAGNVNVNEWDEDHIRIVCEIEVTNTNENILSRLITFGRYNLEIKNEGGNMVISAPKMANHIAIQGSDLLEIVRYEISVPRGMQYEVQAAYYGNVLQAL